MFFAYKWYITVYIYIINIVIKIHFFEVLEISYSTYIINSYYTVTENYTILVIEKYIQNYLKELKYKSECV